MLMYLMMIDDPNDRSKFEQIYTQYRKLMYYVAFKILNQEQDAEDAVHTAFLKIAEKIETIEEAVSPRTQSYVCTIAENKAIDLYRLNKKGESGKR